MDFRNGARMRKDNNKPGPSGVSRNEAFALPENWGGRNCLIPVDIEVIKEIKVAMGGDQVLSFVSAEFAQLAQNAYGTLHVSQLKFDNVWAVFTALLPIVFPGEE